MRSDSASVDGDLARTLASLRNGSTLRVLGSYRGMTRRIHGFRCTTDPAQVVKLPGIDPAWIDRGLLRATHPITIAIVYGILLFDHNATAHTNPDWRSYPVGAPSTEPLSQAAIVYGDASVGPNPLAARLYWGSPGQTADEFRQAFHAMLEQG